MLLFFSQAVPASCESTNAAGEVLNNCQQVYLTQDQMTALGLQINGAAYFLVGFLGVACLLGAMTLILAVGGR